MTYKYPKKIVWTEGGVQGAETLLQEKALQIGLCELSVMEVKGGGSLILDFGEELSGGARIFTHAASGNGSVRLRFGESVSETCSQIGEKNATNDHSLRDFSMELKSYSDMTFGQTGFRFLRIDFPKDGEFRIKSIVAASDVDERPQDGAFECDDELLTKVWSVAARTLRLCLKNGFVWDGIKRDRLVWIGDIYPETKTAHCLFRNTPEIKNSLIFCREQTPEGRWMNDIPTYSVWWLYNLCEYYNRTQDDAFVQENIPFIQRMLSDVRGLVTEEGDVDCGFKFIDWASHYDADNPDETKRLDEIAGVNYLIRLVFGRLCPIVEKFGGDVTLLKESLVRLEKKKYSVLQYKQIAALGALVGEDVEKNVELMLQGGAKGLTTFLNYFIFTALAENGKYTETLEMIRAYYGAMIDLGATSFWEDFDIEWTENAYGIDCLPEAGKKDIHGDFGRFCYQGFRHSLCHGWASGVLAYMSEQILGVKPVEGNSRAFTVQPHLGDLQFVKGKYPTPYGDIEVYAERQADGSVKTQVFAPDGVTVL